MNAKLNRTSNWLELAIQANWSVGKLAKFCGVSPRTLERYFVKTILIENIFTY
jgi:transcriptional regulator GlxA family with amidase domain